MVVGYLSCPASLGYTEGLVSSMMTRLGPACSRRRGLRRANLTDTSSRFPAPAGLVMLARRRQRRVDPQPLGSTQTWTQLWA